jgi:hypothetical protein
MFKGGYASSVERFAEVRKFANAETRIRIRDTYYSFSQTSKAPSIS